MNGPCQPLRGPSVCLSAAPALGIATSPVTHKRGSSRHARSKAPGGVEPEGVYRKKFAAVSYREQIFQPARPGHARSHKYTSRSADCQVPHLILILILILESAAP